MICLGLGSNLGQREHNIIQAVRELVYREKVIFLAGASLYETEPVGWREQPDFLNTVISIDTDLSPQALLAVCRRVEQRLGRQRTFRWGPRLIDIDILCYHQYVLHTPELVLPHPRLVERRFVLVPLCELAPQLVLPINAGRKVSDILTQCADPARVVLYKKMDWRQEVVGG